MALTEAQITDLKNQLRAQVQHLPDDEREEAEQQITELSAQALETMVEQQKQRDSGKPKKTIFRSIVDGETPSILVEETKAAKAVMDITPISKGHVLLIPIKPVADAKQLPVGTFALAKKVAQRISKKLQSKSNLIQTENKFGETVIHVIPSYGEKKDLSSERTNVKKEELESVASQIRPPMRKPKVQKIKIVKKEQQANSLQRQRRIP